MKGIVMKVMTTGQIQQLYSVTENQIEPSWNLADSLHGPVEPQRLFDNNVFPPKWIT